MSREFSELHSLYLSDNKAKYPNFPSAYIPKKDYSDKTANGLTRAIIDFLNFKGHYSVRINTTGQWKPQLNKFVKGTTASGTADIQAIIEGKHIFIEVKIGRDRQSEDQMMTQKKVEKAGGVYLIAKDFDSFYTCYYSLVDLTSKAKTYES